MKTYYKPGTWNCICQLCGRQFKSDEVRKRWDGLIVCKNDWEERHILDFLRTRPDGSSSVPFTSPEPTDVFVEVVALQNTQAIPALAIAGAAKAGYTVPNL